jgi:hypothetical protein
MYDSVSRKTSNDDPNIEVRCMSKLPNDDLYKGEWSKITGEPEGRGIRLLPIKKNKQKVIENFGIQKVYFSIEIDFSNPDNLKTTFIEYWEFDYYLKSPKYTMAVS